MFGREGILRHSLLAQAISFFMQRLETRNVFGNARRIESKRHLSGRRLWTRLLGRKPVIHRHLFDRQRPEHAVPIPGAAANCGSA